MSISDRVMTPHRAHPGAAFRVTASGRLAAARGLDRRPACRCATHYPLAAGHGNVVCPNSVNRP